MPFAFLLLVVAWLPTGPCGAVLLGADPSQPSWLSTWTTASIAVESAGDATPLRGATLRQVVRVTRGGDSFRVRIGNHFGAEPLELEGARLALSNGGSVIVPGSSRVIRFNGEPAAFIPSGAVLVSDPIELSAEHGADLAISLQFRSVPERLTSHPGSRATSFLSAGNGLDAATLPAAESFPRWYFIDGVEVWTRAAGAVAIVGDSITDGYGCPADSNTRWPDFLARRMNEAAAKHSWTVLNLGIGGNRLLRDGLGPNVLARFNRDVLAQPGVRWVVVFAGINDIGTRLNARKKHEAFAGAPQITSALEQLITRAHAHGIKVVGATLTPYGGADFYWSEDGEADRQTVNDWIRKGGRFDAVLDFDAALRDPSDPTRLAPAYDSGDHLHPSVAGYETLAKAVPIDLFQP